MPSKQSVSIMEAAVAVGYAALLAMLPSGAVAQSQAPPPAMTPFPVPDFHFSDPARDAEYWRLEREQDRTMAVFREAVSVARKALKYPAPAPGTPAWVQARASVERAILARRPARDAKLAMINFVIRERPKLTPSEAAYALDVWRVTEQSLRGTSDSLLHLLATLAGIKTPQLPV